MRLLLLMIIEMMLVMLMILMLQQRPSLLSGPPRQRLTPRAWWAIGDFPCSQMSAVLYT
jgi:hypothetical protein